jgi:hypothetical protein
MTPPLDDFSIVEYEHYVCHFDSREAMRDQKCCLALRQLMKLQVNIIFRLRVES